MRKVMSWALVLAVSLGLAVPCLAAKQVPLVSKQTLESWLNDPDLMIIDVRLGSYETSKKRLKARCAKTRSRWNPGPAPCLKTRKLSCTVPDPMRAPASGWRSSC